MQRLPITMGDEAIEKVLRANNKLPIADKVLALEKTGRNTQALALGLNALKSGPSAFTTSQLRNAVVTVRDRLPSGFKISGESSSIGDISSDAGRFHYYSIFDDNQLFDVEILAKNMVVDSALAGPLSLDQELSNYFSL